MTCLLTVSSLFTNQLSESCENIQNNTCEKFDFHWINAKHQYPGLLDNQSCTAMCIQETNQAFSGALSRKYKHWHTDVQINKSNNTDHQEIETKLHGHHINYHFETHTLGDCNKISENELQLMNTNSPGVKRKANKAVFEEDYIPSKRVSPFLNTPKQRKDEQKKILKISVKKISEIDDPEAFLRRTVLVNNLTKRLQSDIRQERLNSKTKCSNGKTTFSEYSITNNCMSDTFLYDDPLLSGVPETITDDMTDTLIRNVFFDKDKSNTNTADSDIDKTSDKLNSEYLSELPSTESSLFSNADVYQDDKNHMFRKRSFTFQSREQSNLCSCVASRKDTQKIYATETCSELEVCNTQNSANNFQNCRNCLHTSGILRLCDLCGKPPVKES